MRGQLEQGEGPGSSLQLLPPKELRGRGPTMYGTQRPHLPGPLRLLNPKEGEAGFLNCVFPKKYALTLSAYE